MLQILVVDDFAAMRWLIKRELDRIVREPFEVVEAQNGAEALELLAKTPDVRLVVCDYLMPQMNGLDLMKQARDKKYGARFLMISSDGSVLAKALKAGVSGVLSKPFVMEKFQVEVERILYCEG